MNVAKFLRAPFFTEHLRWLLLLCALETALRYKYRRRNNLVILEKHTCLDNYIYSFGGNKKNHDFDSANSFFKTYSSHVSFKPRF